MNDQQENLLDHYSTPRNYGVPSFKSSAQAKLQNLSCGDEINVFIEIKDQTITQVSFIGEGCSIAIGTASQLYESLKGKNIKDILGLDFNYPEKLIGIPLTISRKKCAALPLEVIKVAIEQYTKVNQ